MDEKKKYAMLGTLTFLSEAVPIVFEDDQLLSGALRLLLLLLEVLVQTYSDSIEPSNESASALPIAEERTPSSASIQTPELGEPDATTSPTVDGADQPKTATEHPEDPVIE